VDFGSVRAGDTLAEVKLQVDKEGVYEIALYTAPEPGLADLSLDLAERSLPVVARPKGNILKLAPALFKQGEHQVSYGPQLRVERFWIACNCNR